MACISRVPASSNRHRSRYSIWSRSLGRAVWGKKKSYVSPTPERSMSNTTPSLAGEPLEGRAVSQGSQLSGPSMSSRLSCAVLWWQTPARRWPWPHFIEDRPFVAEIDDHHVAAGGVRWCFAVEARVKLYIAVAEILAYGPRRAKPIGAIAVINTERFQGRRPGEFSCVRHFRKFVTRLPNDNFLRRWVFVAALLAAGASPS